MELPLEKRFGIFLIVVSIWYLINLKIFNALQPILAVPGSVTFLVGLWLVLSPLTPTVPPTTITRPNIPPRAPTPVTMKPKTTPTPKPAATTEPKISKKPVRKKKTSSKSSASTSG